MTESTVEMATVEPVAASLTKLAKKTKATKGDVNKQRKLATHPPVNEMVIAAVKTLKDRKGSSLQAIKKYIGVNYKCDVAKLSVFIRKALKTSIEKGILIQTKGTGASGSFKLNAADKKAINDKPTRTKNAGEKKTKKPAIEPQKETAKKSTDKKKATKSTSKTPSGEKKKAKAADPKKIGTAKHTAISKQKTTKPSKTVVKQPKTPKPKKTTSTKRAAAKSVTAKK